MSSKKNLVFDMAKQTVGDVVSEMMLKFLEPVDYVTCENVDCAHFGTALYKYKINNPAAQAVPPTCIYCGYDSKTHITQELRQQEMIVGKGGWQAKSNKKVAMDRLIYGSVTSNQLIFTKRFTNYVPSNDKEKEIALKVWNIAKFTAGKSIIHSLFSGTTGAGKSHLALATLVQYLDNKNYHAKALFVSFADYMQLVKDGFTDKQKNERASKAMQDMKDADFLVIDDLGVEQASEYNITALTTILDSRLEKNLIVTTNLSGAELAAKYNERIMSRLFVNSNGFNIDFTKVKDHRIN